MQIRRHSPAPLAAALLLAATAGILAGRASGRAATSAAYGAQQQTLLDRACQETVASVQQTVKAARGAPVLAIHSHLQVVTPGKLTGQIAFTLSGKQVSVGGPRANAAAMSFGCGEASARITGTGANGSRVVSTLHRTFSQAGRYELTFGLNRTGQQMIAQLGAADNAYFKQHPHGQRPPTLSYGVSLMYTPAS